MARRERSVRSAPWPRAGSISPSSAGCDGVEPDNVDGYVNDTGFDLTAGDQLDFNRFARGEAPPNAAC